MPGARFRFDLPPEKALEFFRAKGLQVSFDWRDMLHEEHDQAFTVAKMMDLDLLADVRSAVERAEAEGWTLKRFTEELRPELQRRGWWGVQTMRDPLTGEEREVQLGSPRRLRIIYDTNLRTSYAAGHWARIEATAARAPYVMYSAILDERTRPMHRLWHGTVLRWDHPWWETHTPPNGWNCRCTVIQLSQRDLERLGKSGPDEAPPSPEREWVNPRTGEVFRVPVGVDPGWGYAPGASRREALAQLVLEKVADSPADLGAAAWAAVAGVLDAALAARFSRWVDEVIARGKAERRWAIAGAAGREEIAYLAARGQLPASAEIAVEDRLLVGLKAARHEAKGDALTIEEWKALPGNLVGEPLVLYDMQRENLLYVWPALTDPRTVRIAVEPQFFVRKERRMLNAVRGAQKIAAADIAAGIKGGQYILIRGKP
jgi:SPP1 gp7 family putative phage head morphogenesis protein